MPQRGDQIVLKNQLNIFFRWESRSVNAGNVSYQFEIRELWDEQMNPQAAFLASPALYSETTRANALTYNNTKPALLPDKTYAWRVRAISTSGIDENAVYKNNGYSEIFHFRLTKDCDAPKHPLSKAVSKSSVKITWQGNLEHNKYHVQYRKVSYTTETEKQGKRRAKKNKKRARKGKKEKAYTPKKEKHEWFEVYTPNEQAQISNLQEGVTYEFRVGGSCSSFTTLNKYYTYTTEHQFTMPRAEETVSYNCGVVPDIQIANQDPLQNIGVNETFTAGDFPVTVKEVEGSNGRFSGKGFIIVPYLADTRIAVAFEGISINTEYQLIDGVVQTTYDPTWGGVEDVDEFVDDVEDIIADVFNSDDEEDSSDNSTGEDSDNNSDNSTDDTTDEGNTDNTDSDNTDTTDSNTSDENESSDTDTDTDTSNNSDSSNAGNNDSSTNNDSSNDDNTEIVIVHENKSYKDGDVIEVEYHREKSYFAFLLKNYPKDANFNWQVLKLGTDNTAAFATNETIHDNLGIDMKQIHILDIVANYNDKKIQVTIKRRTKEFELEELYALHNEKRLAKSGQKLYVIDDKDGGDTKKNIEMYEK